MGNHQVFNASSVRNASEQKSSFGGLRKRGIGPEIDNSLTSKFAAIDFGKIRRTFSKEYRVPKVELPFEEVGTVVHDGTIDIDCIINSALAKHEKRLQQNFLFDRIRAISSETQRINANIDLGNNPS